MTFKYVMILILCFFVILLIYEMKWDEPSQLTKLKSSTRTSDSSGLHNNYSIVIIIQVHDRVQYLNNLIDSLSKVLSISTALLVLSHDVVQEDINNIVRNITFCKVIQIFFPYSIQNYPDKFPGNDPNDCPRDMLKIEAMKRNCNGARFPDKYNHYRDPKLNQIKHHWWWKANYVFDKLDVTQNHTGLFLFLEEDFYVLPDLINVAKLMGNACKRYNDCGGIILGENLRFICHRKELRAHLQYKKINSVGFAIYRRTWEAIRKCYRYFCTFDDYNWDFSLLYALKMCLKSDVAFLTNSCSPRVIHIGSCGVHYDKNRTQDCERGLRNVEMANHILMRNLNPKKINVTVQYKKSKPRKESGGWGDPRDHNLCLSMVNRNV
ncbi:alpha-1,6-mannosyl-glycoprotein 2-beta-N-acetylglucosaminyltransferase-like [Agrilus planipennis]|uniref:Alpha-1,6-mannosyl-glycoprotein 2-beta-N-acetylglucosaminyltransferase n=1 Tax=Agrilus planipennis TaxID=224129 RepID=A0A1W4WS46_AGRPL|nr:alpha-1,6-mannosyl-glycoprotein 2-beta-N-acetylglucosaminyltransferase-like [Agrilus planipennis]